MVKEEILSKLNIKNYSNQLEKILTKKPFSGDAKNLLLNILYKIDAAYDDYCKVKVEIPPKKDMFEEIINIVEIECKDIELVKPKLEQNEILKDKKSIVIKKERKIISYPNHNAIMYALYSIRKNRFKIDNNYSLIQKSMEDLLNIGYSQDSVESIRDFDGWSWNINLDGIDDFNINLVYQNLQALTRK